MNDEHLLQAAAWAAGVPLRMPAHFDPIYDPVLEIARVSGIQARQVQLPAHWWQTDIGALLAFRGEDHHPVALIPSGKGWVLRDPETKTTQRLTAALAQTIHLQAFILYAPLPAHPLQLSDLLGLGWRSVRGDLSRLLLVGLVAGLLGVIIPLVSGYLFDVIIPRGEREQLWLFAAVLTLSALSLALFQFVQGIIVLRVDGKLDHVLQAAIWDRLLNLPPPFFRAYAAGDLAERALGVKAIKRILSNTVIASILAGIFSSFNLILLLIYHLPMALLAVGLITVAMLVTFGLGQLQIRLMRALAAKHGETAGVLLQLLRGVDKLRVAQAEARAFAQWSARFTQERALIVRVRTLGNLLSVFNGSYPILAAMLLYGFTYFMTDLSAGRFLAFNVAFTQLLLACLQLSSAAIAVYAAAPYYERLAPVLQTPLERNQSGIAPPLLGKIEMRDVSFGYRETPILESISLEAQQGEFVAVVGRYGSGKSTLLRLLLGFEQPQHGMILYDGHPLAGLEMQSLRRQIGAVLQNGQIMAGDILNNILGVTRLTIDDAWEAARLACIDQEIRQMPMGMHTYVSEGGTNLSGGQRQRLLLARALVTRPPILLLDEATSALDETTQAQVMQNLRDLHITRIVIAHRLSTIRDADRIYVLEAGRIAEVGTYDTLIRQNGVFASLVQG